MPVPAAQRGETIGHVLQRHAGILAHDRRHGVHDRLAVLCCRGTLMPACGDDGRWRKTIMDERPHQPCLCPRRALILAAVGQIGREGDR
ncbi:MAG: hypothetical protein ACJ8AW_40325 [Rhodopila sp.]